MNIKIGDLIEYTRSPNSKCIYKVTARPSQDKVWVHLVSFDNNQGLFQTSGSIYIRDIEEGQVFKLLRNKPIKKLMKYILS